MDTMNVTVASQALSLKDVEWTPGFMLGFWHFETIIIYPPLFKLLPQSSE